MFAVAALLSLILDSYHGLHRYAHGYWNVGGVLLNLGRPTLTCLEWTVHSNAANTELHGITDGDTKRLELQFSFPTVNLNF